MTGPTKPDEPASARFSVRVRQGVHVIAFSRTDVLDAGYIRQLGDDIYRYLKPIERPRVVIDFTRVRLLSSAAIGMLMALDKVIRKQDGAIRLAGVGAEVGEVFRLTNLQKLFAIDDDVAHAVDQLA